jgi:hypothetical protein
MGSKSDSSESDHLVATQKGKFKINGGAKAPDHLNTEILSRIQAK